MDTKRLGNFRAFFLVASIFGFLSINVPFLYYAFVDRRVYSEAMNNGMALLFIAEAFLLMFFIAFMIAKCGMKNPGWKFFICMSILGSLAFSIPFQLYLATKRAEK
jgi:hypothetical protein